jgi:hypothetical protein
VVARIHSAREIHIIEWEHREIADFPFLEIITVLDHVSVVRDESDVPSESLFDHPRSLSHEDVWKGFRVLLGVRKPDHRE